MQDPLRRPRALLALEALAQSEPMSMREFTHASGHAHQHAQALREDLEKAGLLDVHRHKGHGNAGILEIRLTAKGRRVATHLRAIRDILAGATRD